VAGSVIGFIRPEEESELIAADPLAVIGQVAKELKALGGSKGYESSAKPNPGLPQQLEVSYPSSTLRLYVIKLAFMPTFVTFSSSRTPPTLHLLLMFAPRPLDEVLLRTW
jgi:hypothetical protein